MGKFAIRAQKYLFTRVLIETLRNNNRSFCPCGILKKSGFISHGIRHKKSRSPEVDRLFKIYLLLNA